MLCLMYYYWLSLSFPICFEYCYAESFWGGDFFLGGGFYLSLNLFVSSIACLWLSLSVCSCFLLSLQILCLPEVPIIALELLPCGDLRLSQIMSQSLSSVVTGCHIIRKHRSRSVRQMREGHISSGFTPWIWMKFLVSHFAIFNSINLAKNKMSYLPSIIPHTDPTILTSCSISYPLKCYFSYCLFLFPLYILLGFVVFRKDHKSMNSHHHF